MNHLIERLLSFTGDGVYRYTVEEGRVLMANRGLTRILDLDLEPEALVGRRLKDLMRYVEQEGTIRQELLERGEIHSFLYHFRTLKGDDRWVIHDAFLVTDPATGGRVAETVVKDITALKRAEMALAEEKERLAITLESIGDGVIATDAGGCVTLINGVGAALTGWSQAEASGRPLGEVFRIIHEQTRRPAEDPVAKVLATGRMIGLANHTALIARDGTERSIADSGAPIRDARGRVTGVVLVFRDVSEQRRLEEALRKEDEELNVIFHACPAMIFYKDTENRMLRVNEAFAAAYGLPRAAIEGRSCAELFPRQAEAYWADDRAVIAGGLPKTGILEPLETPAGVVWLQTDKVPIRAPDGRITGIIGFSVDITVRRQAEQAQARLAEDLRRANQDLEQIIHIASHDLRSPLVNIQGFSRILDKACADIRPLLETAPLDSDRREAVDALQEKVGRSLHFILASVEKMNVLISGLLRLSRLGRAPLTLSAVDMNALLRGVLESMAFQVHAAGAQVTVEPLPACRGDPALLGQVFSNLLDNALKYRSLERPLRVTVRRVPAGSCRPPPDTPPGQAVYAVEDNGQGVGPEDQSKIWKLFYRQDPKGSVAGEGVGLAAVRRVVERHGGAAWMEPHAPHGSRFFVSLPEHQEAGA